MVMAIYVSEMSPKEFRGILGAIGSINFTLGILAALCTNIVFAPFPSGWRISMATGAVGGLLLAVGMIFMPFSPR